MNDTCRKIQNLLAGSGPSALRDDEAAQQHLAECHDCFALLESLCAIEDGLTAMPQYDAPDHVVTRLLARPEFSTPAPCVAHHSDREPLRSRLARWLRPQTLAWGSVAAGVLLVLVLIDNGADVQQRANSISASPAPPPAPAPVSVTLPMGAPTEDVEDKKGEKTGVDPTMLRSLGYIGGTGDNAVVETEAERNKPKAKDDRVRVTASREVIDLEESSNATRFSDDFIADLPVPGRFYQNVLTPAPGVQDADGDGNPNVHGSRFRDSQLELQTKKNNEADERRSELGKSSGPAIAGSGSVTEPVRLETGYVKPIYPDLAPEDRVTARVVLSLYLLANGAVGQAEVLEAEPVGLGFEQAALDAARQWRYAPARQDGKAVAVLFTAVVEFDPQDLDDESNDRSSVILPETVRHARAFLDARNQMDGLTFESPTGYWANTYVPGDAILRQLQASLDPEGPHQAARQVGQPFDAPESSALGVYLHTDRRGIDGEGRMLVQVGLHGTSRLGGSRPAMNLAIVLDLPEELTSLTSRSIRALIEAFNQAKQPGDRFRLFVSGTPGVVVDSNEFRHGVIKVRLDELFEQGGAADSASGTVGTLTQAIEQVVGDDDPDAPLGSSAVLLVAARGLGSRTDELTFLAHQAAVAGSPLSVTGVGDANSTAELDRIALAGQGRRRQLSDPADAVGLVDRELAAAGQAIARAVRLRIRLAPGVKLVDIVGSQRLDAVRSERVRQAEQSIDLRIARSLGIEADRGDDEEGIQIVIPSFYAGDSHVILLDVVASGPGKIADVSVRYKDLVQMKNSVARAGLSLGRDVRAAGPLEQNVLKNFLAQRLAAALNEAGRALRASDALLASRVLNEHRRLLQGLRLEIAGFDRDPGIARDIALLDGYRAALAAGQLPSTLDLNTLADSLRYAALLKLLPPPSET